VLCHDVLFLNWMGYSANGPNGRHRRRRAWMLHFNILSFK